MATTVQPAASVAHCVARGETLTLHAALLYVSQLVFRTSLVLSSASAESTVEGTLQPRLEAEETIKR